MIIALASAAGGMRPEHGNSAEIQRVFARAAVSRQRAARPPAGVVARDDLAREQAEMREQAALTAELFDRGHQRFGIFCSPCHGAGGDGNGIVVQRGMPQPTSYHDDRLRTRRRSAFLRRHHQRLWRDVFLRRARAAADRWAIVAYIRALQLSRHASIDDVPQDAAHAS